MYLQKKTDMTPLREEDAYPADPEEGYGWEKLFAEKVALAEVEEGLGQTIGGLSRSSSRRLPSHRLGHTPPGRDGMR